MLLNGKPIKHGGRGFISLIIAYTRAQTNASYLSITKKFEELVSTCDVRHTGPMRAEQPPQTLQGDTP
jgi:hypothetical protein